MSAIFLFDKRRLIRTTPLLLSTLALSMIMVVATAAASPTTPAYTFVPLNFPGATFTSAQGINSQGTISGSYRDPSSPCETDAHSNTACGQGFLLSNGLYTSINAPHAVIRVSGINDNGLAVGSYFQFFFGVSNGFLYNIGTGQVTQIPADPNACAGGTVNGEFQSATSAEDIANDGTIVGQYEACSGATFGFTLKGFPGGSPTFTTLNVPGFTVSANGINGAGLIVGRQDNHGYLLQPDGTLTTINFPTSQSPTGTVTQTFPLSINDVAQIVGYYTDGNNIAHGFLLSNGVFTTVDFPLAIHTFAQGINRAGNIVGGYIDTAGLSHGFIAKPVASTSTTVECSPNQVAVNQPTTCTATVTDTSPAPTPPMGMVTFSSSSPGIFTPPNPCTLTTTSPSSSRCSVTYTPGPGSEGTHTITGRYGGEPTHFGSSGVFSLAVTQRTTTTSVSCAVAFLTDHHATPCTATVTDTSPGTAITPSGTVDWKSSGKGTFSPATCSVSGAGGTATCTVTYTASPGKPLPQHIDGTYSGDTDHTGSSGTTPITTP